MMPARARATRACAVLLAMAAAALLTACAGDGKGSTSAEDGTTAATPVTGGTLRVGVLGKRSAIERDPHQMLANDSDFLISSLVFEALTVPGDAQVAPRLASEWRSSEDLRRWTFTIAEGARFHDGRPVTADDVVWSLKRLRRTASGATRMPGVRESGIRKASEREVLVVSDMPSADLPMHLRLNTFVLPKGTRDPERAPGSGPFELRSYDDGNAVLVRNDRWHGGRVHLDRIEVKMFEEPAALANAVLSGQIDYASNVGSVAARLAEERSDVRVIRRPGDMALPIVMRVSDGPFADARVREAIKLAVDRPALVAGALNGYGTVANDVLGVADPAYAKDLPQRGRDLERARELLAAADFDTDRTYELFTTSDVPGLVESATLFAAQVKDAGVKVKVVKQDSAVFWEKTWLRAPLYTTYWGTNDSVSFFAGKTMLSTADWNETGVDDPKLDALYRRAVGASDPQSRRAALRSIQQRQHDSGGYLVWGMADGLDLARPHVRNVPTLPGYGRVFLEQTWLQR